MTVSVSVGLLVLRLIGGLTIAAHGAQKAFSWFEGPGITRFRAGLEGQGLRPGWLWVGLVVVGELGGGLSVAFGFLTPLGAAGMVGAMTMAIALTHWKNGFFNSKRGIEFPLQLLAIATAIGIAGPGAYSLDALFHIALPETLLFVILALAALVVDAVGLGLVRAKRASQPPAGAPSAS